MTKRNQGSERARVIAKAGSPPVHAFEADDDFDVQSVIDEAYGELFTAVQLGDSPA